MNHLGDITKINGQYVPITEVVIGGTPCQDLSVAGKRKGLAGERSSLFMEQIRVIKEMRDYDERNNLRTGIDVRPRYMVWENVPGAFSSNKGKDFYAVLEETARIIEKDALIPEPPNGKWRTSGCIMGDRWSIAWRVLDAQFWGVPQRRRRIVLVADFGGYTAPEILFERESVSGDSSTCRTPWEGNSGDAENGVGITNCGTFTRYVTDTAGCNGKGWRDDDISFTLNTVDRPAVYDARGNGDGAVVPTITGDRESRVTAYTAICIGNGQADQLGESEKVGALNCMHDQQAVLTYMPMQAIGEYRESDVASPCKQRDYKDAPDLICAVDCRNGAENPDINGTLQSKSNGGMSLNPQNVVRVYSTVRRLTPLECERLQGFPDGWTDIGDWINSKGKKRKTKDGARYKALGNSIALPPWRFVLSRLNGYLKEHTMASLFDGIGGFPLVWQELNGPDKCLWASEIDEFAIAVTKRRF